MRRVLVSLVLGASLAVIGAGSALAWNEVLPDKACNGGTTSAAGISENDVVPWVMTSCPLVGSCMNMPELSPNR
jgi:hypothetical protein